MYQKHSLLREPQNSLQKLWRYLTYERLLQIINEGVLHFRHITKMSDKWEGLLTNLAKDKLFRQQYLIYKDATNARAATGQYEQHKDLFYINCWHMNDYESYLMWKVYGDRGCAIQTDYKRLVAAFGDELPAINGCMINYIDYERDQFDVGNIFLPVSHKDLPYRDEKEFRLLCWKPEFEKHNLPFDENGVNVRIDVNMLIEKIFINPSKNVNIEELQEQIEKNRLNCMIENSRIKNK